MVSCLLLFLFLISWAPVYPHTIKVCLSTYPWHHCEKVYHQATLLNILPVTRMCLAWERGWGVRLSCSCFWQNWDLVFFEILWHCSDGCCLHRWLACEFLDTMAYISKQLRRKELEDEGQYLQCILYVLIACLLKNEVLRHQHGSISHRWRFSSMWMI